MYIVDSFIDLFVLFRWRIIKLLNLKRSMQFPLVSIILYLLWAFNIRLLYDSLLFEFPSNKFIFIGNGNMIFHKDLAQFSNKNWFIKLEFDEAQLNCYKRIIRCFIEKEKIPLVETIQKFLDEIKNNTFQSFYAWMKNEK